MFRLPYNTIFILYIIRIMYICLFIVDSLSISLKSISSKFNYSHSSKYEHIYIYTNIFYKYTLYAIYVYLYINCNFLTMRTQSHGYALPPTPSPVPSRIVISELRSDCYTRYPEQRMRNCSEQNKASYNLSQKRWTGPEIVPPVTAIYGSCNQFD